MSSLEKLIKKIFSDSSISYNDAEKILFHLGFSLKIRGSHHVFSKNKYVKNISIKKRKELYSYQVNDLRQVLRDHGY